MFDQFELFFLSFFLSFLFCLFDRFCVGDRFYLHENKILCEYDYEERMVFANLSLNNMEQVRRQTKEVSATTNTINTNNHANNTTVNDQFCDVSSGYGSSDSPFEHWTNDDKNKIK